MSIRSVNLGLVLAMAASFGAAQAQTYNQPANGQATPYGQKPPPPLLYPQQLPLPTPAPNPNGPGVPNPYGTQDPYGARNPYGAQTGAYGTQNPYGATEPNGGRRAIQPFIPPQTPLPADPNVVTAKVNPLFGLPIDPPGYGWCRYTDDANKRTFYSAPFPGSPKHDLTPRDIAFAEYIHRAYPGFAGNVDCYWQPFDSAYQSKNSEDQNESGDQLRNYRMLNTQWKPPPV